MKISKKLLKSALYKTLKDNIIYEKDIDSIVDNILKKVYSLFYEMCGDMKMDIKLYMVKSAMTEYFESKEYFNEDVQDNVIKRLYTEVLENLIELK